MGENLRRAKKQSSSVSFDFREGFLLLIGLSLESKYMLFIFSIAKLSAGILPQYGVAFL